MATNVATILRFEQAQKIEPALECLDYLAQEFAKRAGKQKFCANAVWYRGMKPILEELVGWNARNPRLRSSDYYDAVYNVI